MSSLGSPNPFFIAGKKAYEVKRSLRFNDGDTAYLSRTPSSAGNRKKWTFSAWIKRGVLDNTMRIFGGNANASHIFFYSNNVYWDLAPEQSGSSAANLVTQKKFRDVGAWFHLVCALDTDESTANNRMRMYINGEEVTTFSSRSNPSSGYANNAINNNTLHTIGYRTSGQGSAGIGFDGYMAEINFIDGQQYDASYFGETDAITGQWNPKKYTGGYGTNGFYLNFSTDTLGTDRSGNGNNFTPNNFSVVAGAGNDALEDTPTNNFATMNPLVPSPSVTWANGNLDLAGTSSTQYSQNNTSTFGVSSGKWYVEVKFTNDGTTNTYVGICPIKSSATTNMTGSVTDAAVLRMSNETYIEGSDTANIFPSGISSGDIIGIALDMDNLKVWFSLQGTYANSGNPATGVNAIFSGITAGETMAICARPLSGTLNFNFGQRPFAYTPPTGFKTLCSANLSDPTILDPTKHFGTLIYEGNSSTQVITDTNEVDFTSDWVWVKRRDGSNSQLLFDSVRGVQKWLTSSQTTTEGTNALFLTAFNNGGFTSGNNGDMNVTGRNYVAWNWNAGDTDGKTYTVTVVDSGGNKFRFDGFAANAVTLDLAEGGTYIFNYPSAHPFRFSETSDGTHGGGTEYTTGVTVLSSTSVQIVVAASAPQLYYFCNQHSGMGGAINTNSTLGSSNFDGTIQSVVKASPTAGFSIINYTGNGTDGATVGHGLGVAPDCIITKSRNLGTIGSAGAHWTVAHKGLTNGMNGGSNARKIHLSLTQAEGTNNHGCVSAVSSTTFTLKDGSSGSAPRAHINESSGNYVAYVFSEVANYSKFGTFTGNGNNAGPFIFLGFTPALIIYKNASSSADWVMFDPKRIHDGTNLDYLEPNTNDSEGYLAVDILSNGFKLTHETNTKFNGSGNTFIYLAFAESPFKNARAR